MLHLEFMASLILKLYTSSSLVGGSVVFGMSLPESLALLVRITCADFTWVFQEAVLPTTSFCYLGPISLPMLKVGRVAQWLYYKQPHLPSHSLNSWVGLGAAVNMVRYFDFMLELKQDQNALFSTLLISLAGSETSEPLDSIFGLLGIYAKLRGLERLPRLLKPDYSQPIEKVATWATIHAMRESHSLGVLDRIRHRYEDTEQFSIFPSWAPRWHRGLDMTRDCNVLLQISFEDMTGRAVPDSGVGFNFERSSCLLLQGLRIGTANFVTDVMDEGILQSSDRLIEFLNRLDANVSQLTDETLALSLVHGVSYLKTIATSEDLHGLSILREVTQNKERQAFDILTPNVEQPIVATEYEARKFYVAFKRSSLNRRLFLTSNGSVGSGPAIMQTGDIVVIAGGGWFPIVLRRCGDSEWHLVGTCYLPHICIQGQLRQAKEEGMLEEFRVR